MKFFLRQSINYRVMCIIALLQGLVFYAPISTIYKESHGISVKEILILESILIFVMLIFEIPWGRFADKLGYKNTIIICAVGLFISKIVLYNAYTFKMFLIQTVISGISLAGISGCDYALIYESIGKEESDEAFGVYQAFGTAGFFIAAIGSSFLERYSLNSMVFMTIIAYGSAMISTIFLKENRQESIVGKDRDFKNVIRGFKDNKEIEYKSFIFIITIFIVYEIGHCIEANLIQLQYVQSSINYGYFGIITVCAQILCILSAKIHLITRKIGQTKTIILLTGIIIGSIVGLLISINPIISITSSIVIQITVSLIMPILVDIQNKSIHKKSENRATIMSIYSMIGSFIGMIINWEIAFKESNTVENLFETCLKMLIIIFIVMLLYSFRGLRNKKKFNSKF
ncbi:MAG: MFS transporter [Clostridium sp.]